MFRYDESDPQFLIIYTGDEHATPDDYRALGERWITRLEKGERFGIILVDEPHEHHDDEDMEEHRQHEAEIVRLINDFRRDYRDKTAQLNVGYARVARPEWKDTYFAEPGSWEQALEQNDRQAQYNWGIPGGDFWSLDDAKVWIREQFDRAPIDTTRPAFEVKQDQKVGLFYGSSTGITEYIADEIASTWEAAGMDSLKAINIGDLKSLAPLVDYDCLILGLPTWNIGQLQDDWDIMFPQLDTLDFTGKKVAMFGIGDQYGYPDNFIDAVGILGEKLLERGAQIVGYWYDEHYKFDESKAFVDGKFMGLAIDDTNQSKLNSERIENWLVQIISEFDLQPAAVS